MTTSATTSSGGLLSDATGALGSCILNTASKSKCGMLFSSDVVRRWASSSLGMDWAGRRGGEGWGERQLMAVDGNGV